MSEQAPTFKELAKSGQLPHAEITAAIATVAETAGVLYTTEVLASPGLSGLLVALNTLPDTPFVTEAAISFGGDKVLGGNALAEGEAREVLRILPQIVHWLTCDRSGGDVTAKSFIKRTDSLVTKGKYQPVADALHVAFSPETTKEATRCFAPVALLSIAAAALTMGVESELSDNETALGVVARTELINQRADPILQQLCQRIATGKDSAIRLPGDQAVGGIVRGAMRALDACRRIGDSDAEVESMATILLATWLGAKLDRIIETKARIPVRPHVNPLGIAETPLTKPERVDLGPLLATAKARLVKGLASNGIRIDPKVLDSIGPPHVKKAAAGDLLPQVNRVYSKIKIRQVANRLVQAVADGEMLYATLHSTGGLLNCKVLGMHADEVAVRKADELLLQVEAEQARRRAYEEVLLREVTDLQALGWQPLRPTEKRSGEPRRRPVRPAERGEHQGKRKAEVDGYRLAALEDIKLMYPGAEIYWRPDFKHRKKDLKPDAKKADEDDDEFVEYWVLVIPRRLDDGRVVYDAIAECAELDTAAYLWLAEWGMDAAGNIIYDWKKVFDNDRPYASKLGAVPLFHPSKVEVRANPGRAAGRFRNRLVGLLTKPFMGTAGTNARYTRQQSNYRLIISDEAKLEVDLSEEEAARLKRRVVGGVLNVVAIDRPAA